MKKVITLFLLAGLLFTLGCKKESTAPQQEKLADQVIGSWQLKEVRGAQVPGFTITGIHILKFSATDYQVIEDGKLTESGKYSIVKDAETWTTNDRLVVDNAQITWKRFVSVSNGQLTIYSFAPIAADGREDIYERIQTSSN